MTGEIDFLGPVDTAFLYAESDIAPMNLGAVTIFEGQIARESLMKHVEARLHQAPTYLKRLIEPPLNISQLRWSFDPTFRIQNHIFATRVNAPGTDDQLREVVGRIVSRTLDRSKPLWEIHVINGLSEDRSALLFKVHHAMVDGLAAVELFTLLMDPSADATDMPAEAPFFNPPELPDAAQLVLDSVTHDLNFKWDMLNKMGAHLNMLGSIMGNGDQRRNFLQGVVNLVSDALSPMKPLAINGKNGGEIQLTWSEFPLAEVHAIRAKYGASVNDVMLAVLSRAVDLYESYYHGIAGRAGKSFRVLIPVNMRVPQEKGEPGNRISLLPIEIPLAIDDAPSRLKRVIEYTRTMKQSHVANGIDVILTLPALSPAITQPLIWSAAPTLFALVAHSWCTNVAGPPIPVYIMGHQMLHSYGFFPLNPSMGLASVIVSYNERITLTLVTDKAIIPDAQAIRRNLETAYAELRTAAGVQPMDLPTITRQQPRLPEPVAPALPQPPVVIETPAPPVPEPVPVIQTPPPALQVVTEPVNPPHVNGGSPAAEPVLVVEAPPQPVAAAEPVKSPSVNGNHAPEVVVQPVKTAQVEPTPSEPPVFRLFSENWATAFREAVNHNVAYQNSSTNWRAGSLAFVLKLGARYGAATGRAVWLDLYRGDCRAAEAMPVTEASARATFVIEGDYRSWIRVLRGEIAPLAALMRGELHLGKGSLIKLLPFTQSAQELLHSAQMVPLEAESL